MIQSRFSLVRCTKKDYYSIAFDVPGLTPIRLETFCFNIRDFRGWLILSNVIQNWFINWIIIFFGRLFHGVKDYVETQCLLTPYCAFARSSTLQFSELCITPELAKLSCVCLNIYKPSLLFTLTQFTL